MKNFILQSIELLGMSADGFGVGLVGSVLSIIYKVNGFSWKMTVTVFLSGGILSGYAMPVIVENWDLGRGTGFFAVFIIGYLAPDFFSFLKSFAPTLFKMLGEWIGKKLKKNDTTDK